LPRNPEGQGNTVPLTFHHIAKRRLGCHGISQSANKQNKKNDLQLQYECIAHYAHKGKHRFSEKKQKEPTKTTALCML